MNNDTKTLVSLLAILVAVFLMPLYLYYGIGVVYASHRIWVMRAVASQSFSGAILSFILLTLSWPFAFVSYVYRFL